MPPNKTVPEVAAALVSRGDSRGIGGLSLTGCIEVHRVESAVDDTGILEDFGHVRIDVFQLGDCLIDGIPETYQAD